MLVINKKTGSVSFFIIKSQLIDLSNSIALYRKRLIVTDKVFGLKPYLVCKSHFSFFFHSVQQSKSFFPTVASAVKKGHIVQQIRIFGKIGHPFLQDI